LIRVFRGPVSSRLRPCVESEQSVDGSGWGQVYRGVLPKWSRVALRLTTGLCLCRGGPLCPPSDPSGALQHRAGTGACPYGCFGRGFHTENRPFPIRTTRPTGTDGGVRARGRAEAAGGAVFGQG
jgi:hypothetical protein